MIHNTPKPATAPATPAPEAAPAPVAETAPAPEATPAPAAEAAPAAGGKAEDILAMIRARQNNLTRFVGEQSPT